MKQEEKIAAADYLHMQQFWDYDEEVKAAANKVHETAVLLHSLAAEIRFCDAYWDGYKISLDTADRLPISHNTEEVEGLAAAADDAAAKLKYLYELRTGKITPEENNAK